MSSELRNAIARRVMRIAVITMAAIMLALPMAPPANARFLTPDTWDPWLQGVSEL